MKEFNKSIGNNANLNKQDELSGLETTRPHVIICHQKEDTEQVKLISDYLIKAGIDVYFEMYDESLKFYGQKNAHKGLLDSIYKGINENTHLLCVISPNTLKSKWVFFEEGNCYNIKDIDVLVLKGISKNEIPDYIKTAKVVIKGIQSINQYISQILHKMERVMASNDLIKYFTIENHPLDSILEKYK